VTRHAGWLVAGALLVILAIAGQGTWQRLDSAVAEATFLRKEADSLREELAQRAKELRKRDTVLVVRATTLARQDTALRQRVEAVQAAPVPVPCAPVVAARDRLLTDCQRQAADWREQSVEQKTQAASWRAQYEAMLVASARLNAANDSLRRGIALATRRRSFLGRLLHPELRPGITVGPCLAGCEGLGVVAGITLSF
jgi:hypothetical protein